MKSIEFGKKCRPYNIQYRDIFGYAPCREDYICNQDEYFNALRNAIVSKTELSKFLRKRDNGSKNEKITIRKSNEADEKIIKKLFIASYGYRRGLKEPFIELNNRYRLLFVNNDLVAMTGLKWNDEYRAMEIDWTCTHPNHRHKGYMQLLFKDMLKNVKEDVYCSCWRIAGHKYPNLFSLMSLFNFKRIIENKYHCKVPYNCHYANGCKYNNGLNCECYEDLYLRKYTKK